MLTPRGDARRWCTFLVAAACALGAAASTATAASAEHPIRGFGVDGQPRQWGTSGAAVKPALDRLVNDLGATLFRVEIDDGETTWETTNDDANPSTFNWAAFDPMFSTPAFLDLWAYVRYLNRLGVPDVELAAHGLVPNWLGGTAITSGLEDEYVESLLAVMLYARDRAPDPRPSFTLFSPWNETDFGPPEGISLAPQQGVLILQKLVARMARFPELNGIQLVAPDAASYLDAGSWRDALASAPTVTARLAGVSFHRYGDYATTPDWTQASPAEWMTEFNSTWRTSCYDTTWGMGLEAAGNLISALQGGVSAGLVWSDYDAPHIHQSNEWQTFGLLATNYQGKSGAGLCGFFLNQQPADAALDAMTYAPKPTYFAVRHAFKWIRPGAIPVPVTSNNASVNVVAYRNTDGSVAVYGRNTGSATSVQISLSLTTPPSSLTPRVTDANASDNVGSPVRLTNGTGTFSLTAQSVFTLLSAATTPSAVPAASPITTGLFALVALGLGISLLRRERAARSTLERAARRITAGASRVN